MWVGEVFVEFLWNVKDEISSIGEPGRSMLLFIGRGGLGGCRWVGGRGFTV